MTLDKDMLARLKKYTAFYYYKFNLKTPMDDILNDIIVNLIESKYLEKYDESRPIHNFISGFVYYYFCRVYRLESTAVNSAVLLSKEVSSTLDDSTCVGDYLEEKYYDVDFFIQFDAIFEKLISLSDFNSFAVYDNDLNFIGVYAVHDVGSDYSKFMGKLVFRRDAVTVFNFLLKGFSKSDIAKLLKTSNAFITKVVKRLSTIPELRELAKDKGYLK